MELMAASVSIYYRKEGVEVHQADAAFSATVHKCRDLFTLLSPSWLSNH